MLRCCLNIRASFSAERHYDDDHEHDREQDLSNNFLDLALVASLKSCADAKNLSKGRRLHADILGLGSLRNVFVGSTLVNLYAKCGALAKAQQLLDELPSHIVSWNSLIAGFAQHERGENAINCFQRMQSAGVFPDPITYACVLKSCSGTGALEKGRELHADIVRQSLLETNVILGNALVDMYAKCGAMAKAQQVFWDIPSKNIISWTTLIAGYCHHEHGEAALYFLDQMHQEGLSPNPMTFACALKACGSIGAFEKGKELHEKIISKGMLGKDVVLGNVLMVMYIKCGALIKAQQVFDELPFRNVVSWTGLITGYCLHGHGKQALHCFEQMKNAGFPPNAITFSCIVKACGSIGAPEKGEEIFAEIARRDVMANNAAVGNALVDMYAKCGVLSKAREVFEGLQIQDVVSWTALISGYCEHGYCKEAFNCFEGMKQDGSAPDAVTFACILKACGSLGAADRGETYFDTMSTNHGITPALEHRTCMITLFSREGYLNKAIAMIKKMSSFECIQAWRTLVGACQKWGNSSLGRLAFEHSV